MSNVEVMYSAYFIMRLSEAKPHFDILRFDIRYSAVRRSKLKCRAPIILPFDIIQK